MKNLQLEPLSTRGGAGTRRGKVGQGESKNSKPISVPSHGAGLKSCPIPTRPPLRGRENPHGVKQGGTKLSAMLKQLHSILN